MRSTVRLLLACSFAWSAAPLPAQCQMVWSSGTPQPELTGLGKCSTLWDPDGAGPAPERLVIGGAELRAANEPLDQRVMTWDGSRWQALGPVPGTNAGGSVDALAVWNGALVAGGTFTGGGVDRVALWNGAAWQPLGVGFPIAVTGLTAWNGELVAVGWTAGATLVRRWNGTAWTALPAPPLLQRAFAVTSFQGVLWVGGSRISSPAGGVLERWNGTSWLSSITANDTITCFAGRSFSLTSTLFVGGGFTSIGGAVASRLASTSGGTVFQQVGNGLASPCTHVHVRATSALGSAVVACVEPGLSSQSVYQLSGSTFVAMGFTRLRSVSYFGGSYFGATDAAAPVACHFFENQLWKPVRGPGIVGEVLALTRRGNDILVGGTLSAGPGPGMNGIARWNGTTLQNVSGGVIGLGVDALLTLDNGDVVAGGSFDVASSLLVNNVARWNGSAWSPLANGLGDRVHALCKMPNGDLIAGGAFVSTGTGFAERVARWNGSTWSALGAGLSSTVRALAVRSDGTLFAGGDFANSIPPCNFIAQWNGTGWLPVGTGLDGPVHALAVLPNDDVVAVGAFTTAGGVPVDRCARWNGIAWTSMGADSGDGSGVHAVLALPNGDVLAGRGFHQPSANPDTGISRWNGAAWSGFGTGLAAASPPTSALVRAFVQDADGDVIVGGTFGIAGGLLSRGIARLSPTCPAIAQAYGAGCSSAAGPLVLATETLPWLGATFRTATTGIGPLSLCLGVTGFTQLSIPLPSLLAEGQPGCSLLTSPDIATLLPQDGAGVARSSLAIPPSPSLVGAQFFQQTVPLEFTGLLALAAVRSSNALALTIGTL